MDCDKHKNHTHEHNSECGHVEVKHNDHIDYLHDGHLHHQTDSNQVEEHTIEVTGQNPSDCTPSHECSGHDKEHIHGPNCGHEAVPHGNHTDYLVDGHLHHPHGDHCDDHGTLNIA
jgi:hypothetical protein